MHCIIGFPLHSKEGPNRSASAVDAAYMLLEHIGLETEKKLAPIWPRYVNDTQRCKHLFQALHWTVGNHVAYKFLKARLRLEVKGI
jgi:hypothetical protein